MLESRLTAAELVQAIFYDAVAAVRADSLLASRVQRNGDLLEIDGRSFDLSAFEHIYVVGAGKASAAMAAAVEPLLGDSLTAGIVSTKEAHSVPTAKIRIVEAAHPIPDERSVKAGEAIYELVSRATERDLVICLITGGASALMELPREDVTLEDLQETTDLMMRAGAPIFDLNAVRACLSRLKAGGLARTIWPAQGVCLVISDILGNPLDLIGGGPCWNVTVDQAAAQGALDRFDLWERVPDSVRQALHSTEVREAAAEPVADIPHFILADIWTAINAARESAEKRGLNPDVLTGSLKGEARDAGRFLGEIARDLPRHTNAHDCIIAGGETTVTVRGSGRGGRSQELATAAAMEMTHVEHVALLAGGTDGTDGPTDAAGGIVEGETIEKAWAKGLTADGCLADNDTYHFLEEAGALLKTGPTQTNVGDLVIAVFKPAG